MDARTDTAESFEPRGVVVRVIDRAGGVGRPEIEIEYDGLTPPTALFSELAAGGWDAPVPAPPPAHAIDWSRPDPATGARYTVEPYRVTAWSAPTKRDAIAIEQVLALVDRPHVDDGAASTSRDESSPPKVWSVRAIVAPEVTSEVLRAHPTVEVVAQEEATRHILARYRGVESEVLLPAVALTLRVTDLELNAITEVIGSDAEGLSVEPVRS